MKTLFFIALSLILSGSSLYSQDQKMSIGLQSGIGISNIKPNFDEGLGVSNSIFFEYEFTSFISVYAAIGHQQIQGRGDIYLTDEQGNPSDNYVLRSNFQYVSFPLLMKTSVGSEIKYFAKAGPSLSYLAKQKTSIKEDNLLYSASDADDFNRTLVGVTLGVGMEVPIANSLFFTGEVCNNWGLSAVNKNEGDDWKTNNLLLMLGLSYAL